MLSEATEPRNHSAEIQPPACQFSSSGNLRTDALDLNQFSFPAPPAFLPTQELSSYCAVGSWGMEGALTEGAVTR